MANATPKEFDRGRIKQLVLEQFADIDWDTITYESASNLAQALINVEHEKPC